MTDTATLPIRVYYEDTDAGGVVYYANYLRFFERGRTEWLRGRGIEQDGWLEQGVAFVVRRVEMDNLAPARFNDLLQVRTRVLSCRRASLEFVQEIVNSHDQILCRASVKIACVDLNKMKPQPIPPQILGEIASAS